jgi:uncharacterized damage-inducible protein DinB
MDWTAPQITRIDLPLVADECSTLEACLDYHRRTLQMKCAGLTAEQLKRRAVAPSSLTLLGLVRHMAEVERSWFRRRFAGEDVEFIYVDDEDMDREFNAVAAADAEADFATYLAEVDLARAAAAGHSLDETFVHQRTNTVMSLRWVYVHMIEEYARHNGHADILREQIDGATGE